MLIVRPIVIGDLPQLLDLAELLDSMNLPRDRDFLESRIRLSENSFAGELQDWRTGVYMFVLEEESTGRVIGASLILAKNGRPDAPYYWLSVTTEERRSIDLDRRFEHTKLQLHSTVDGPT